MPLGDGPRMPYDGTWTVHNRSPMMLLDGSYGTLCGCCRMVHGCHKMVHGCHKIVHGCMEVTKDYMTGVIRRSLGIMKLQYHVLEKLLLLPNAVAKCCCHVCKEAAAQWDGARCPSDSFVFPHTAIQCDAAQPKID